MRQALARLRDPCALTLRYLTRRRVRQALKPEQTACMFLDISLLQEISFLITAKQLYGMFNEGSSSAFKGDCLGRLFWPAKGIDVLTNRARSISRPAGSYGKISDVKAFGRIR